MNVYFWFSWVQCALHSIHVYFCFYLNQRIFLWIDVHNKFNLICRSKLTPHVLFWCMPSIYFALLCGIVVCVRANRFWPISIPLILLAIVKALRTFSPEESPYDATTTDIFSQLISMPGLFAYYQSITFHQTMWSRTVKIACTQFRRAYRSSHHPRMLVDFHTTTLQTAYVQLIFFVFSWDISVLQAPLAQNFAPFTDPYSGLLFEYMGFQDLTGSRCDFVTSLKDPILFLF